MIWVGGGSNKHSRCEVGSSGKESRYEFNSLYVRSGEVGGQPLSSETPTTRVINAVPTSKLALGSE